MLTHYIEIETTVLQGMSYCFYEMLDNVLTHSGKEVGTVLTYYDANAHVLRFLVADVASQYNDTFLNDNELEGLW